MNRTELGKKIYDILCEIFFNKPCIEKATFDIMNLLEGAIWDKIFDEQVPVQPKKGLIEEFLEDTKDEKGPRVMFFMDWSREITEEEFSAFYKEIEELIKIKNRK